MADKTIFQLPPLTLDILQSGVQVSFVAQVDGYDLDFQVSSSILLQYIGNNYQIGVSGGANAPDNAAGDNGDIYFKSDGTIYQKSNGVWSVKTTLSLNGADIVINLTSANPQVYDYTFPGDVSAAGLSIYAETVYADPDLGTNVWVPYDIVYKKVPTTNHIFLIRSDPADVVKVTIKGIGGGSSTTTENPVIII